MKVFEAVTAAVASEGFDHLFAVMGDANQDLIVNLGEEHGVKFVHAHHEGSAVSMADGFARFSQGQDKMGLASVTQGPGYTNATTSLVAARFHRTPVLLLAGNAPLRDPYNPQGVVDQHALGKLTTKATVNLDSAKTIDYCLGEAFRQLRAKKGPFMARRPAILCGLGAVNARAEADRELRSEAAADAQGERIACAESAGMDTLAESDVMIVVGASLNEWTTDFGKILENGKKIIQIDVRSDAFGWFARVHVGIEGDAKAAAASLLSQLKTGGKPRQPDAALEEKIKARKRDAVNYDDGATIDPRRAARYIEETLPKDDRTLVFDGGHAAMVFITTLSVPSADDWGPGFDFGAVGQGLGIALGACFARPGKRVTHLTGDASFMMNVADFHTAVNHNLPLTVFVFNDNAVGQEKHDLVHKKLNPRYAEVKQPNFAKLAVGFGAKGFEVTRPDDLGEIDKALAVTDGPVVVDVRINGDVELPASWEIAKHLG